MINEITTIAVHDYDKWTEPKLYKYKPHAMRPKDVDIEIECCGVCGSDVHAATGHWGRPYAPVTVGHEIIGRVVAVGPEVTRMAVGDRVGVGAQADCCHECDRCARGKQNNCKKMVGTYFGTYPTGENTQGGYASHIRIHEEFVFQIPPQLTSVQAASMMCGGITGLNPLFQANVGPGTRVGVAGIGGIGHMTILFAKALGAEVTAISRSSAKKPDAEKLGADHFVDTSEPGFAEKYGDSLDIIVYTGNSFSQSSISTLLGLLTCEGELIFVTNPPLGETINLEAPPLLLNNYKIGGTCVGAPANIERMLKLAAEKNVHPWVQTVPINEKNVSDVWQKMEKGDVRYRYVFTDYDKFFKK